MTSGFANINGITSRTSKFIYHTREHHLTTRVREHLCTNKNSHIFKHLKNSASCKDVCNESCFKVLDTAKTYHNLRIKEALHITWERPDLNKQLQHYNVSLTF